MGDGTDPLQSQEALLIKKETRGPRHWIDRDPGIDVFTWPGVPRAR